MESDEEEEEEEVAIWNPSFTLSSSHLLPSSLPPSLPPSYEKDETPALVLCSYGGEIMECVHHPPSAVRLGEKGE